MDKAGKHVNENWGNCDKTCPSLHNGKESVHRKTFNKARPLIRL